MTYKEKFKDPRWQKKRLQILERDLFACKLCSDTTSTLHVHHRYYEGYKDPWDYNNSCLITLCESCHEIEETSIKQYYELFYETLRKSIFMSDDWREIAAAIHYSKTNLKPSQLAELIHRVLVDDELQDVLHYKYFKLK